MRSSKPASRARTTSRAAEPSWRSASPCSRENEGRRRRQISAPHLRRRSGARTRKRRRSMRVLVALAAALAVNLNAAAQTYPSRPVNLVVGFAPGGGTDTVARVMQRKLGEYLGQTVVVENRAGAGGTIAADVVSKATPDGYTILLATIAALAINPHLNSKLPYKPLVDFAPISMATVSGNVLVVNSLVQAKTLAEYVKAANAKPGGMP